MNADSTQCWRKQNYILKIVAQDMISVKQNYLSRGVFPIPTGHMNIKKFQPELAEIAELRQLDRLGAAKQRWRFLLEKLSQEEQLQINLGFIFCHQNVSE